jgi:hypothetical protein
VIRFQQLFCDELCSEKLATFKQRHGENLSAGTEYQYIKRSSQHLRFVSKLGWSNPASGSTDNACLDSFILGWRAKQRHHKSIQ